MVGTLDLTETVELIRLRALEPFCSNHRCQTNVAELKTPFTETKFIPFPNEATFSDCPASEVAQVAIKSIRLPNHHFIPGHEFSASLYRTTEEDSWTGEIFSGIKCTCWFQMVYTNDFYNIAMTQFCLTSLVLGVWTLDHAEHGNRTANDFVW